MSPQSPTKIRIMLIYSFHFNILNDVISIELHPDYTLRAVFEFANPNRGEILWMSTCEPCMITL